MHRTHLIQALVLLTLACGGGSNTTAPNGSGSGGNVTVNIADFSFSPATLTVKVGTTVIWNNTGPSAHTTASDTGMWSSPTLDPPTGGGGGYGDTGSQGGRFAFTFTQAGTFGYHCNLHPPAQYPSFVGTITVTP